MRDNFRSFIERNVARRLWAVRQEGAIAGHRRLVVMEDAEFSVHAVVAGVLRIRGRNRHEPDSGPVMIAYDPHTLDPLDPKRITAGVFVRCDTRAPVYRADLVHLMPSGRVLAWGVS